MPWLRLLAFALGFAFVWHLVWRLVDLSDGRRLWRNSSDPVYQGDGWRWTLSLLLPGLLLRRRPDGYPVTLHDLPLTAEQRKTSWLEWALAQEEQERLGRPLERWETIDREEQP